MDIEGLLHGLVLARLIQVVVRLRLPTKLRYVLGKDRAVIGDLVYLLVHLLKHSVMSGLAIKFVLLESGERLRADIGIRLACVLEEASPLALVDVVLFLLLLLYLLLQLSVIQLLVLGIFLNDLGWRSLTGPLDVCWTLGESCG